MKAQINGISLAYDVTGPDNGPPVVLHHPLATDRTTWDPLTAVLKDKYRVIRLDARGHGESEAPAGAYDFEMLSADVIGLMDHLGVDKAHLIGLSMGGMVGQWIGVHHPDRFKSLCLFSTASAPAAAGKQAWMDRIATAEQGGMAATVDGALGRWLTEENRANRPDLVALLTRLITATPVAGFAGWCHAISSLNITEDLAKVTLPTLVVVGALDPSTPPAAAQAIHEKIAGSDYAEINDTAHMLQLEDPESFHAIVLPFLEAQA